MRLTTDELVPSGEREYYHRRSRTRARRSGFGEAMLLVFGLVLAALAMEGGARMAERARLEKDGYAPVRGRRSREPMNAEGYRDIEHSVEKPAGVRRALFVGDSFTYGVGVLLDDTYPKREERALSQARGEPWESIIMAMPGIDSEQEAVIAENEGLKYSPDVVILGYVLNDAEDPGSAEERRAKEWTQAEAEKRSPAFWRRSALLRLIAERIRATRENRARIENHLALYWDGAPGFQGVKRSIERMARVCRERGIPFVVAIFPLFANPLDEGYPFTSVHDKMAALCRAAGVTFVDLLPYYRGMDWRLLVVEGARDEHPSELAHRIAAQALLGTIGTALSGPSLHAPPS